MIRKHAARISYVHLKGWRREPFAFTPLDEGDLDMAAIMRALDRHQISPAGSLPNSTPGRTRRTGRSVACVSSAKTLAER